MMKSLSKNLLAAMAVLTLAHVAAAENFYASNVVGYLRADGTPHYVGDGDGHEFYPDPSQALGGPTGSPGGSLDVVTLGKQGSLTLGFADRQVITNGPGADFIVFENPVQLSNGSVYAELMFVGVSSNGTDFAFFPAHCEAPPQSGPPFLGFWPDLVSGFAGVNPVRANVGPEGNTRNPFDPAAAGGDAFDLSSLSSDPLVIARKVVLNRVAYVKLVDIWGDGTTLDSLGHPIYDPTGLMTDNGAGMPVSADVDGMAVINGFTMPRDGDINNDGHVDISDLTLMSNHYGTMSGCDWGDGDFNGDGAVDISDLTLMSNNYGTTDVVVPAPAAIWVLLAGVPALLRRRRSRNMT